MKIVMNKLHISTFIAKEREFYIKKETSAYSRINKGLDVG